MVIDISFFMNDHPGGKFSLKHNVGRDVSKYFYGGYSMENQDKVPHNIHSNDARKIVTKLCVGFISEQAPIRIMKLEKVDRIATNSGTVKTFRFGMAQKYDDELERLKLP